MYEKLAGMTGTAITEASEFMQIYGLEVVEIPTNRPIARVDQPDVVYKSEEAKFDALVEDITYRNEIGQPVLVGTVSIERSERISRALSKAGITHEVLNAKQHAREAEIIAQAGRLGAVTVATNMAGRGVDIMLGGNPEGLAKTEMKRSNAEPGTSQWEAEYEAALERYTKETDSEREEVLEAGGLYVLGTERHESRRIDNQLRGRSGRQGDPGESRFYLSLADDLMARFATDRVSSIMERLKIPDDVPIEAKMVSKAIERAQSQVESRNFEIRKNVLKYDEVMNRQREVIYRWRNGMLRSDGSRELMMEWIEEAVTETVYGLLDEQISPAKWDWDEFIKELTVLYPTEVDREALDSAGGLSADVVANAAVQEALDKFEGREAEFTPEVMRQVERRVMLSLIDNKWREHLAEMDYLRAGIGLRAMGQRDPLTEYQREGYDMFSDLVDAVKRDAVRYIYHVEVAKRPPEAPRPAVVTTNAGAGGGAARQASSAKVGRNAPCPCGSGKKAKKCGQTESCMAYGKA
jgi:preprotein translocase subunit SecA